jgi:hypothetical protein
MRLAQKKAAGKQEIAMSQAAGGQA